MMRIPETEAARDLARIIDQVTHSREPVMIERDGKELVMLVPVIQASDEDSLDADSMPTAQISLADVSAELGRRPV